MNEMKVARGLGWFSIGLGLAEIVAGREIGRTLGMEDRTWLIRAYGVREIASGIAIFSQDTPRAGVWSRVAGDVLDLATLVSAYSGGQPEARQRGRGHRVDRRDHVRWTTGARSGSTAAGRTRPTASISSTSPTGRAAAPPRENSRRPIGNAFGPLPQGQTGPRPDGRLAAAITKL